MNRSMVPMNRSTVCFQTIIIFASFISRLLFRQIDIFSRQIGSSNNQRSTQLKRDTRSIRIECCINAGGPVRLRSKDRRRWWMRSGDGETTHDVNPLGAVSVTVPIFSVNNDSVCILVNLIAS